MTDQPSATFTIKQLPSAALDSATRAAVIALCNAAYEEELSHYLDDIGPGVHLLGWLDGELVSHLIWVDRLLYRADKPALRSAYIELVATAPAWQGRGYASQLLRALTPALQSYALGALSPSDVGFYQRFGWEEWRGPLSVRQDGQLEATPEEEIMILRTANTPPDLDLDAALSVDWRRGEVW